MVLPTVTFADGIQTTALGFGCGTLFRIPSSRQRSFLLNSAYDVGIRHFDVAPMYGLGRAEAELGAFTRFHRAEVTVATKYGITPTLAARTLARAQQPIRRVFAAKPPIRAQAVAHAAAPSRLLFDKGEYHAAGARRSLERSLRALNTDYLDMLLLHDPLPGSVRSDEVSSFFEDAHAAGLIRSWGVAGDLESAGEVTQSFQQPVPVRQFRHDIFCRPLGSAPAESTFITFGAISGALTCLTQYVSADDSRRARWREVTGTDCGDPGIAASFLLQAALRMNSAGVVLFSTTQPSHVRDAVTAAERFYAPEGCTLDTFLHMIDTELRGVPGAEREHS